MSKNNKINIAVIGATGYTGLDLTLLLSKHPLVNIKYLCATKKIGKSINFFDKRIKKKLNLILKIANMLRVEEKDLLQKFGLKKEVEISLLMALK